MVKIPRPSSGKARGGVTWAAHWRADPNPDLSHLARWADEWSPGAIYCKYVAGVDLQAAWVLPALFEDGIPKGNWRHVSKREKYKAIRKYGSLWNADRAYGARDVDRFLAHGRTWALLLCEVTVSRNGKTAEAALGSLESDRKPSYLKRIAAELVRNATALLRQRS